MKGTIVGTIIRPIRSFLRFDHFPGPQYGADRFRMGLFYGSNARTGQIPGGFYTAPPLPTHNLHISYNRPSTGPLGGIAIYPPFHRCRPWFFFRRHSVTRFFDKNRPSLILALWLPTWPYTLVLDQSSYPPLLDPVRLSLPQLVNNFLNCVRQSVFDYPGYFFFFAPINRILRGPSAAVNDNLSRHWDLQ